MYKKIIFMLALSLANVSFAETCPTTMEIKSGIFRGWQPFNVDSGEPITNPKEIKQFQKNVVSFNLAEWMPDAPEGPSHCYYNKKEENQSFSPDIYLVKTTSAPKEGDENWQPASLDNRNCTVGVHLCRFQD